MYKQIENFENYLVDENGNVFNTKRKTFKKPTSNGVGNGYMFVELYKNGKHKRLYVHRLVAQAFIPNPKNKPYINHKDGNPKNNCVDNLEWCTPLENVEHAAKTLKVMRQYKVANDKRKKPICGFNILTKKKTEIFNSICEASKKTNIPTSNIVANLKGRQTHTKNIIWCYVEDTE